MKEVDRICFKNCAIVERFERTRGSIQTSSFRCDERTYIKTRNRCSRHKRCPLILKEILNCESLTCFLFTSHQGSAASDIYNYSVGAVGCYRVFFDFPWSQWESLFLSSSSLKLKAKDVIDLRNKIHGQCGSLSDRQEAFSQELQNQMDFTILGLSIMSRERKSEVFRTAWWTPAQMSHCYIVMISAMCEWEFPKHVDRAIMWSLLL